MRGARIWWLASLALGACDDDQKKGSGEGGDGGVACAIDDFNDPQTARVLALETPSEDHFCPAADRDWYRFSVPEGSGVVSIHLVQTGLNSPVSPNYRVHRVEDAPRELVAITPSPVTRPIVEAHCTGPGDFYLELLDDGDDTADSENIYRVEVQSVPDATEPNQAALAATPVGAAGTYPGFIACKGDQDWYVLAVAEGEQPSFRFTAPASSWQPTVRVLDSAGNVLITETNISEMPTDAQHDIPVAEPGSYFIVVSDDNDLDADLKDGYVLEFSSMPIPDPDPDPDPPAEDLSINSLIPNRGLSTGGTPVRVVGTGFAEGMTLTIGGQLCGDLVVDSNNLLHCTTPAGPVGPVEVFASLDVSEQDRRQAALENGFTYYEAVRLTQVRPERIPVRGGIQVELRGSGLVENTRVTIAGQAVADVEVLPAGSLLVLAPPGEPGPADVTVANFNGQDTLEGGVFYYEEVEINGIEPPVGPLVGGTAVALRGAGLVLASQVMFGDGGAEVQAASDDRDRLDVLTPPAADPGPVDVSITNENGEFTVPGGFVYYDEARNGFSVAGLAPAAGPVSGGNAVFIAGSGFTANTEVSFDGRPVVCNLLDAHRLRCTAPPSLAGPVDVEVVEGAESVILPDGYTYFDTLELIAVQPDRGSVAGGTIVTLIGLGFVDGMQVRLGDLELLDVQVLDETTALGTTPPNTPGPVDVRLSTEFSRAVIPGGYRYFDPITRFGGVWGEPIEGAVNVTVLNAGSGQPEAEAVVLLVANDGDLSLEGLSNAQGQVTLSSPDLRAPAKVTAAKEGFEVTTIEDVEAENVTIYLLPNDGEGEPPPGVPAVILRGVATGLDLLPKPIDERYVNVIFIETSHFTPYDRNRMPEPGPGGLLFEDGPFEIIARPGELAIVATAAEIDRDVLKDYQDGLTAYWTMRTNIRPISMGLRRFISASPGETIDGLDVVLDHPMDFVIPMDLDNPPLGMAPGPQYYGVLPRLYLGAEGYWEIDTQSVNIEPSLSLQQMPRLDGWDQDVEYYLISLAFSDTADNTPMSINVEQTRDVDAGLLITPFVGSPFFINPGIGGTLGADRHVTWGVSDGYDGPIRQPSANLVTIEEPALGPPKPLWRYVTPSLITEFDVPVLPESAGGAGLGRGLMILNIIPFIVDGQFNFDDFTYDELAQFRWKSWGVATTTFRP